MFAGAPNTIKQQQREFQALKKKAGNTHLARGMVLNQVALFGILGCGSVLLLNGFYSMALGVNKIKKADD